MAEAARLADQVSHTFAVAGEIGGSILGGFLGALVATAAVAAIGLTGGLAIVAFVVIGAAVGAAVHSGSMSVAKMFSSPTGVLAPACSPNVFANSRNSARVALDFAVCSGAPPTHYPPHPVASVAEGSSTVFINSMPAARKGDALVCGAKISEGSGDVFIGGATLRLLEVQDEVPLWAKIVGFIASIPAGMAGARIGSALVQGIRSVVASVAAKTAPKFTQSMIDNVVASSARGRNSQITEGARAIAKKLGHAQSGGYVSAFKGVAPTQANAESQIRNIMSSPSHVFSGNKVMDIYNAVGQGVRINSQTGAFQGFIEKILAIQ